jgi:outer membrane receptor protein involved in Fe transport
MKMTTEMNPVLRHAVRMALLGAGAFAASTIQSPLAQAQTAPKVEATPELQEVVVTGSRIATPNLDSISPVTAITSEEIKSTGVTKIEDLLNSLPQVTADQGSGLSMGSTGVATINLRGLGVQRTLVLVNGRRLMGGDPGGGAPASTNLGYTSAADINQIPVALVERVDVLTGGASSTYGADAVAGVVNFVMNDHFEGVRLDSNFGIYNHNNHEDWLNPLLAKRNFPTVTGTNWDGENKDITLIMGHNFADGAGNFEGYLGYRRNSPITADHRDHAACVLDNGKDLTSYGSFAPYVCGGSSTSAPAIIFGSAAGQATQQVSPDGTLVNRYQRYNYAATHYLQRIDERYTSGFFGHLKFNDHVEAYTEFMFMDDETRGNYASAGAFLGGGFAADPVTGFRDGNFNVNCGVGGFGNTGMNPYLTADEFGKICSPTSTLAQHYDPTTGVAQLLMGRRNIEGGPREDQYSHTTYRGVFGARGELVPDWNYDASMTYGGTRMVDNHQNDTSSALLQNTLLAVRDPVSGQIVCQGRQAGCVPWNIFNPALGIDPKSTAYFSVPSVVSGASQEDILTAFVSGDLTHAGIKLPTAEEGLKVVFGTEYRRETDAFRPDQEFVSADLGGIGSPTTGFAAGYHVWEGFTEARMPLVHDQPFVKALDLEAGYRYSSYSGGFNTSTYKFGIEWAPVGDVRLRASYNKAVRVPNLGEVYKTPYVALDSGGDLCAPGTKFTAAQCALTGLNPAQYGSALLTSSAGQYNGLQGGNLNLRPEEGKTTAVGLVFTPSFVPGFSATLDYSDIKMTGVITSYGPNIVQANCIASGDAASVWCKAIHRDSNGTLWASPDGYTVDPLVNLSGLENKSVDVSLAYRFDMGSFGKLRSRMDGTYLLKLLTTPGANAAFVCAGRFGSTCAPVTPKWRHRLALDWDTPLTGLGAGVTWRFFGGAKNTLTDPSNPDYVGAKTIAAGGPPADAFIPTISYLDLRASYAWNKVTVRAGVNNVLDKDPPLIDTINSGGNSNYAESNTYPSLYDTAGRFLYLSVTVDF